VTGFSLVVVGNVTFVVTPNVGIVLIVNGALVVTGFSLVLAVLNEGEVLIVVVFSLVVVIVDVETIGVIPNDG
jgi:hypothetical protein